MTQGWAFADRFGESFETVVGRLCGAPPATRQDRGRTRPVTGPKDSRRPTEGWQVASCVTHAHYTQINLCPVDRRGSQRNNRFG